MIKYKLSSLFFESLQMSKLLCNALKISGGGQMPQILPRGCAPAGI